MSTLTTIIQHSSGSPSHGNQRRNKRNNSGESGQTCLVPDLRGNGFSFSPLRMMLAVGLSYMTFIMLRGMEKEKAEGGESMMM